MDALVCSMLRPDQPFGHQRLFGAYVKVFGVLVEFVRSVFVRFRISWGIAAPAAGLFFDRVGWSLEVSLLFTLVGSIGVVVCLFFAAPSPAKVGADASKTARVPFMVAMRETKLRWQQICFLVVMIFAGFASSSIGIFLFLLLKQGLLFLCLFALSK